MIHRKLCAEASVAKKHSDRKSINMYFYRMFLLWSIT